MNLNANEKIFLLGNVLKKTLMNILIIIIVKVEKQFYCKKPKWYNIISFNRIWQFVVKTFQVLCVFDKTNLTELNSSNSYLNEVRD